MGNCSSKNQYLKDIEQVHIPEKKELPSIYKSTNNVFFKNDIMSAYLAQIQDTNTKVVIKKLSKIQVNQRLLNQEISALKHLDHPNIGNFIDFF